MTKSLSRRISGIGAAVLLSLIAFSAATATDLDQAAPTGYAHRYAICVGIDNYTDHPALNAPVNDATAMAEVFERYGFDEVITLTDCEATREAILGAVGSIRAKTGDADLFVFYYAGHGWTVRGADGVQRGYLVTVDCAAGREADEGISMAALKDIADSMPSRHNLFLTDACYSGFGLSDGLEKVKATRKHRSRREKPALDSAQAFVNRTTQILTAGGSADRAFESDGHGLFTRHLLACLRGETPEAQDGVVSGSEIAGRVNRKVRSETGGWQSPKFGRAGSGEVVFELAQLDREEAARQLAMVDHR